jgi:hypothetical protein
VNPRKISLSEWDARHTELKREGLVEAGWDGPLSRHLARGDRRLSRLAYDDSAAALALWNLMLSEEERLHAARAAGWRIVGTMKDLGTVPVLAFALPRTLAFYPDGAWWIPCIQEHGGGDLEAAAALGVGEAFCPVRAMLGAFANPVHFPIPDLLVCSTGATCDDFSAIVQRLAGMGHEVLWWEIPPRREPDQGEAAVTLPSGERAPAAALALVRAELGRVARALGQLAGCAPDDALLLAGIAAANRIRAKLRRLREICARADPPPLPALELMLAEVLAIHFCSDRAATETVVAGLLAEAEERVAANRGPLPRGLVRTYWVNPVADLKALNLLEDCGGRLCGADFMIGHALLEIPTDCPPLEALARCALSDPLVGSGRQRAAAAVAEARRLDAEALVVSRIPGASHCAWEGAAFAEVAREAGLPCAELEVPTLSEGAEGQLRGRLEALFEVARGRRMSGQSWTSR